MGKEKVVQGKYFVALIPVFGKTEVVNALNIAELGQEVDRIIAKHHQSYPHDPIEKRITYLAVRELTGKQLQDSNNVGNEGFEPSTSSV